MTTPLLPADSRAIAKAASVLRDGGLVAFPTETVYGLGADATSATAVGRVFTAKGRPYDHPLIVHVEGVDGLDMVSPTAGPLAHQLATQFWPGPLTVVVPRGQAIDPATCGGLDTVAVRAPRHRVAHALLKAAMVPVAAPSANRFGRVSPTTAAHVAADLGDDLDLILDGGPCPIGVESTIVDCTRDRPAVLRVGGIPVEDVVAALGCPVEGVTAGSPKVSGSLASHYAPHCDVELASDLSSAIAIVESLVGSGRGPVGLLAPSLPCILPRDLVALPAAGSSVEYARVLYLRLREADEMGLAVLVAVPPPSEGMGAAVIDRLQRAAAR